MLKKAVLVFSAIVACCTVAAAGQKNSPTRYVHYGISGTTAPEILASLHRRGPTVYGVGAYASTKAEFFQKGAMLKTSKSCKLKSYDLQMKFVIKLPKLNNQSALKGSTAKAWSTFEKFVLSHERTHQDIWLGCTGKFINKVTGLSGPTCDAVEAKALRIWTTSRGECEKRHAAFDAAERSRLARQPLIRLARKGGF